ncbi:MAG: hypothetical protein COB61_011490 [Thiotrichales bacterium]|nr:hypothetical protein [Thiotrichales bacterium]
MDLILKYVVASLLLGVNGLAAAGLNVDEPDKTKPATANIIVEQSIDRLDIDQVTPLTLVSRLMDISEAELDIHIKMLYAGLSKQGFVVLPADMAKYAMLLKAFVPTLCQSSEGNRPSNKEGQELSVVDLSVAHLSGAANANEVHGLSIISDMHAYDANNTVLLTKQLFPLMMMSILVCDSINQSISRLSDVGSALNRAGYQLGTLVVMDPNNPAIEELRALNPFTQNAAKDEQTIQTENKELEQGYVEVDDNRISDLEISYEKFKHVLKTADEVIKDLAFLPSPPINETGFDFLGAEGVDVESHSGYTGVFSIYNSPIGKVAIAENDLIVSQGVTFIEPDAFNTVVGEHPAVISVYKGKQSGIFKTEIYWYNAGSSREYTVEVNLNLNDQAQENNKKQLFDVLTRHYGSLQ